METTNTACSVVPLTCFTQIGSCYIYYFQFAFLITYYYSPRNFWRPSHLNTCGCRRNRNYERDHGSTLASVDLTSSFVKSITEVDPLRPSRAARVVGVPPCAPGVAGSLPSQGTDLGCPWIPGRGAFERSRLINVSVFSSPSPHFPFSHK